MRYSYIAFDNFHIDGLEKLQVTSRIYMNTKVESIATSTCNLLYNKHSPLILSNPNYPYKMQVTITPVIGDTRFNPNVRTWRFDLLEVIPTPKHKGRIAAVYEAKRKKEEARK